MKACAKCGAKGRQATGRNWWLVIKSSADDVSPDVRYDFCTRKCLLAFKEVLERVMSDSDTFI